MLLWSDVGRLLVGMGALVAAGLRMKGRGGLLAGGGLLGLVGLTAFTEARWRWMPLWTALGGMEWGLLLGGVMALAGLRSRWSGRRGRRALEGGIVLLWGYGLWKGFSPFAYRWLLPQIFSNFPDSQGLVRQTVPYTCAGAAAAMWLHRLGIRVSEGEMVLRSRSDFLLGTDEWQMAQALDGLFREQRLPYRAHVRRLALRDLLPLAAGSGCLATLWIPNRGPHMVAVVGTTAGGLWLADPYFGALFPLGWAEWNLLWTGTTLFLDPSPPSNCCQPTSLDKARGSP